MASQLLFTGDVLVVQIVADDSEQVAIMNRYFRVSAITGFGTVNFSDVAGYFDTNAGPALIAILNSRANYKGVRVRRLDPPNVDQWAANSASAGAGTAVGPALPRQTSGLVKLVSAELGKHGSGRMYLPFPARDDNETNGQPTAGYVAAAATFALNFSTTPINVTVGGATAVLIPVLWDRVARAKRDILGQIVEQAWATQKRRGAFGRANLGPF